MNNGKIKDLIVETLQDLEEELELNKIDTFNYSTVLFGKNGLLDSMGLVTLITDLEEKIEEAFSLSIVLANEKAMSKTNSPFRTVLSLAEYIDVLITE